MSGIISESPSIISLEVLGLITAELILHTNSAKNVQAQIMILTIHSLSSVCLAVLWCLTNERKPD